MFVLVLGEQVFSMEFYLKKAPAGRGLDFYVACCHCVLYRTSNTKRSCWGVQFQDSEV